MSKGLYGDFGLYGAHRVEFPAKSGNLTTQSINDSAWTTLSLDRETNDFDPRDIHDESTNNSRITMPEYGIWLVGASVFFDIDATGDRLLQVQKNGDAANGRLIETRIVATGGGLQTAITVSGLAELNDTDYIEALVWQNSGGALDVLGDQGGPNLTKMWAMRLK